MEAKTSRPVTAFATVALFFCIAPLTMACFVQSKQPVQVWLDHVEVEIRDGVAIKTYDCAFKNPNATAVVGGVCYMEIEPGTQIDGMVVEVNGKKAQPELLSVKRANKIFRQIVGKSGQTALLEYYGNQLIRTQLPRIAPNGLVKVKLRYTTVLKEKDGLVRLKLLNTNPKATLQPLKAASVRVSITSKIPIKNVYSPTHQIRFVESPDHDITVEWAQTDYLPEQPFVLYYQYSKKRIGASLLAHREPGEEKGTFMIMLSPTFGTGVGKVKDKDVLAKDIVFCVDTSGSMLQDNKLEQAQAALRYCIGNLRPKDTFNIVNFGTVVRTFKRNALVPATRQNIRAALAYVDTMRAQGGTAMEEALAESLGLLDRGKNTATVFFVTDGLPTIGETKAELILKKVGRKNRSHARVFVFGQGIDVNTRLLDFLATENQGEAEYVLKDEKAEDLVAGYFDRVGSPLMKDIKVEFEGGNVEVTEVYPKSIGDLYRGEQLVVYGRYTGDGPGRMILSGCGDDEGRAIVYGLEFPEPSDREEHGFVPRLWAGMKVNALIDQMRYNGKEDEELIEVITELARTHGIITPYTGYLLVDDMIQQDQMLLARDVTRNIRIANDNLANWDSRPGRNDRKVRGNLVNQSKYYANQSARTQQSQWRSTLFIAQNNGAGKKQVSSYFADGRVYGASTANARTRNRSLKYQSQLYSMQRIRYVGARTFYNSKGTWYDSRYKAGQKKTTKKITAKSEDFQNLLKDQPQLARYLALGNVVVNSGNQWFEIQK